MTTNSYEGVLKPVQGLPHRPVHSYQSSSRLGRGGVGGHHRTGVNSKFNKNQENGQWPQYRAPTRSAQQQPLGDRSNRQKIVTTTPNNSELKLKSSNGVYLEVDCPVKVAPTPVTPFQLPHLQLLRTGASPRSARRSIAAGPSSSPKTPITPVTRRRLAVEGIRKAASNAALRKMGILGGFGWGLPLDQSFTFNDSQNFNTSLDEDTNPSSTSVDNGSTTPCDTSFASEQDEEEEGEIYTDSIIIDEGGSTTPCDTSYEMDHADSILFDDLHGGSTTPLYDTSFSVDHSESSIFFDINGGSTTPCDTSFVLESDHVLHVHRSTTPSSADNSFDLVSFQISVTSHDDPSMPRFFSN